MTTADCGFSNGLPGSTGAGLLVASGPTLLVDIGFDSNFKPNPGAIPVAAVKGVGALVDTGATESCIDSTLATTLGLPIMDRRKISGSGGEHEVNVHLAQIYIPSLGETIYGAFAAVDLAAGGQKHQALIGRTFLQHLVMNYNGVTGKVTLTFNKPQPLLPGLGGAAWKPTQVISK